MNKIIVSMIVTGLLSTTFIASVDVSKSVSTVPFANIYVDDDNTQGPWDGTIEHPYRTIIQGVDNASEGDTVFVFNGIYRNEYIYVRKSIKLVGENRYNTIIDGPHSAVEVGNNQLIDGFEISNFMMKNLYAIYLYDCSHCKISENNIIGNNYGTRGIWLTNCSNCTVSNNIIRVHWDSITIRAESVNNKIDGNYLYGFNESLSGIDISSDSNNTIISNNAISNCGDGIDVHLSDRTIITDNKFINNTGFGITFFVSSNSTISRNKITSNDKGIESSCSDDVIISDNIITDNGQYGISLSQGKNIVVSHNIVDNNPCGIAFCYVENSVCANNTITNSSESGIDIMDSGTIAGNNLISYNNVNNCYCGIVLDHSWGNAYKNNIVNCNEFGILLYGEAYFNVITQNEVRKNGFGVVLYGFIQGKTYAPLNNWVVGNNISENTDCGVYATVLTRLNQIYYNNLMDNYQNAYDNGTNIWYKFKPFGKSMGNYWDDYTGSDNDGDGIGDSPYDVPPLPFRNKDRYPCMEPINIKNTASSYSKLIQINSQSRSQPSIQQSNPSTKNQPNSQPGSQVLVGNLQLIKQQIDKTKI